MSSLNETCRVLLERRTVRRFRPDPVPPGRLRLIVRCGAMAASAGNRQPWEFLLVESPTVVDEVTGLVRWFGGTPQRDGRPAAHVVLLLRHPDPKWTAYADGGAAAQNMLVAAWSMGIASCWAGSVHTKRLRPLLGIPEQDVHVFSVLSFGLADETPAVEPMADEPPEVFRDGDGVLHVQKRPLDQICFVDRYGQSF